MAPSTCVSPLCLGPATRLAQNKLFTATRRSFSASASNQDSYGHHYDGKLVDESMIVLRLRIREIQMKMKMKKKKKMSGGGWRIMEWERRYWEQNYGSDICEAVGLLQILLMETRPCLALAILLSVLLSLSLSMSLSLLHLLELGKHISSCPFISS